MPTRGEEYQQQFNKDRAKQEEWSKQDKDRQTMSSGQQTPSASFPWGMLCLAIFFDAIGIIPILNFFTEIIAGLLFGMWQKSYAPKTDPILTFFIAKIIDTASLGILPSNIGIVVYSFIKKKAENLAQSPIGKIAMATTNKTNL